MATHCLTRKCEWDILHLLSWSKRLFDIKKELQFQLCFPSTKKLLLVNIFTLLKVVPVWTPTIGVICRTEEQLPQRTCSLRRDLLHIKGWHHKRLDWLSPHSYFKSLAQDRTIWNTLAPTKVAFFDWPSLRTDFLHWSPWTHKSANYQAGSHLTEFRHIRPLLVHWYYIHLV